MIVDVHAHAASEDFIRITAANPGYGMPYEVRPDGSYTVYNSRNKYTKTYAARS